MSNLGRDFLDEALSTPPSGVEQAPPPPPPAPVHTPPASPSGGYGPLIAAKRKELEALEKKIDTYRESGVYIKRKDDGREVFDDMERDDDIVRIGKLSRELNDLQRKQDDHQRLLASRGALVQEMARSVFRRESARMSDERKRAVAEQFAAIYQAVPASEWVKSNYADRAVIEAAILQLIHTAVGRVTLGGYAGAPPSGADPDEGGEAKSKDEEDDVDDFTNNVLYALQQRKRGGMSVADMRRAEAAKERGES